MVTITQFVYVKEGKEEIFQQFESLVLPLIPQYNGKLLLRLRTGQEQLIEGELERLMKCIWSVSNRRRIWPHT